MRGRNIAGALLIVVVLATLSSCSSERRSLAPTKHPNIVFLLTDDLDVVRDGVHAERPPAAHRPGCDVQSLLRQRLVVLPVALVDPAAASTRTTPGVETNGDLNGGFETAYRLGIEKSTIGTWLHDAGYRTAYIGKYLNEYPDTASHHVRAARLGRVRQRGRAAIPYTEYDYTLNENGTSRALRRQAAATTAPTCTSTRREQFIRRSAGQVVLPLPQRLRAASAGDAGAAGHRTVSDHARAPRTPSFNARRFRASPAGCVTCRRSAPAAIDGARLALPQSDPIAASRRPRRRRVSIDTLRQTGQLANTYFVFSSDNGFHLGQFRMPAGKETPYDTDIRVPLVVRGPGVPARRDQQLHGRQHRSRADVRSNSPGLRPRASSTVVVRQPAARSRQPTPHRATRICSSIGARPVRRAFGFGARAERAPRPRQRVGSEWQAHRRGARHRPGFDSRVPRRAHGALSVRRVSERRPRVVRDRPRSVRDGQRRERCPCMRTSLPGSTRSCTSWKRVAKRRAGRSRMRRCSVPRLPGNHEVGTAIEYLVVVGIIVVVLGIGKRSADTALRPQREGVTRPGTMTRCSKSCWWSRRSPGTRATSSGCAPTSVADCISFGRSGSRSTRRRCAGVGSTITSSSTRRCGTRGRTAAPRSVPIAAGSRRRRTHRIVVTTTVDYRDGDAVVFGCEATGLGDELLAEFTAERRLHIPMRPSNRSVNLANSVSVVAYEAWRQHGFAGAATEAFEESLRTDRA